MMPCPPRSIRVECAVGQGARVMHVYDWGDLRLDRTVVCVHGLSRNGRDFDVLAHALSDRFRVLCPDVPGRGLSDWLPGVQDYTVTTYVRFMDALLEQEGIAQCDWIGTSMGGLIGLALAARPASPVKRFVINDVGPAIERAALERIGQYITQRPVFDTWEAMMAFVMPALLPFGPLTDRQRRHLLQTSVERRRDGGWQFRHDPKIGEAFVAALSAPSADLWPLWEMAAKRGAETLILRGEHSDLLSKASVTRMLALDPTARCHVVPNTGHAPMMMDRATIDVVREFLLAA